MSQALVFRATVPFGGVCGGTAPCWHVKPERAARYANKSTDADGVASLVLIPGASGQTKITLTAKGPNLSGRPVGIPSPPLPLPLIVQLQGSNGTCFGTVHSLTGLIKNDAVSGFKGRGS